jgi:hypothetical protein
MILACVFGPNSTHKGSPSVHVNHTPQPAIDLAHSLFTTARVPQANSQQQTVQIRVRPQVVNYDATLKIDAFPCLNNYGLGTKPHPLRFPTGRIGLEPEAAFCPADAVQSKCFSSTKKDELER